MLEFIPISSEGDNWGLIFFGEGSFDRIFLSYCCGGLIIGTQQKAVFSVYLDSSKNFEASRSFFGLHQAFQDVRMRC